MRPSAIRMLTVVVVLAGVVGCQSAPRWAWWKRDTAPEDTSLVARSAAPTLPSTQATPKPVDPPAPPSSANLASAGAGTGVPGLTVPAASADTIASAPRASYPATGDAPSSSSRDSENEPAAGSTAGVLSAQAGPYDPDAYQSPVASSSPAPSRPTTDRYASAGSSLTAPTSRPDRYATTKLDGDATPQVLPSALEPPASQVDRYGLAGDRYALPPSDTTADADAAASQAVADSEADAADAGEGAAKSNERDVAGTLDHYRSAAGSATASSSLRTGTATTVQLTAPAGEYRPGGTSSYAGATTGHLEIASRPERSRDDETATPRPSPSTATPPTTLPTAPPHSGTPDYRAY